MSIRQKPKKTRAIAEIVFLHFLDFFFGSFFPFHEKHSRLLRCLIYLVPSLRNPAGNFLAFYVCVSRCLLCVCKGERQRERKTLPFHGVQEKGLYPLKTEQAKANFYGHGCRGMCQKRIAASDGMVRFGRYSNASTRSLPCARSQCTTHAALQISIPVSLKVPLRSKCAMPKPEQSIVAFLTYPNVAS